MISGNDMAVLLSFLAAGVALAGFSAIVTSVDRSRAAASSEVITFRVRLLVIGAVVMFLLAIAPILIDALEVAPTTLWQLACIFGGGGVAGMGVFATVVRRQMSGRDQGLSRALFVQITLLAAVAIGAEILGAGGVLPARGAYFLGLSFALYSEFMLFYRLVRMADEGARASVK